MELQKKHKYDAILDQEDKARLATKQSEIDLQELRLVNLKANYQSLKKRNKTGDLSHVDLERMKGFWEDMSAAIAKLNQMTKDLMVIASERERYNKGSAQVYGETNSVAQRTGKARLYVGNRQYVAAYASKDPSKKKRTLDMGIWSWGLNFAWIEGGIDAGVEVKIKLHENAQTTEEQFAALPEDAWYSIAAHPTMSGAQWLKLCEQHKGTILWVEYPNESRPSWTALEIKACLDAGYRFLIYDHKKKDGQAIKLVKS
jgi:hypothetical protein